MYNGLNTRREGGETVKKRLMTMGLALALALSVLGLSLALGGGDAGRIVGSWTWNAQLGEVLARRLEGAPSGSARYFDLSRFDVAVRFDFYPDGAYCVQVDRAAFDAAMDGFLADASQGMTRYLSDVAAQSGMTLDGVLAATGVTMDDLMGTLRRQLEDEMALSRTPVQGRYWLEGKQLYLSPGLDAAIDPGVSIGYAFRGGHQLRLAGGPGTAALLDRLAGLGDEALFPILLTR